MRQGRLKAGSITRSVVKGKSPSPFGYSLFEKRESCCAAWGAKGKVVYAYDNDLDNVKTAIGIIQTIICVFAGFIISLIEGVEYLSFVQILLLIISQLPILITNVFLGIWFGSMFNDKTAPGICSVLISLAGMLGGCWMPIELMGGLYTFCRCLPFYPSVYIGRLISNGLSFDAIAGLGFIPIAVCMVASILISVFVFKKNMVSDK